MARGYPDYFGTPIFPTYGPLVSVDSGAVVVASMATEIIASVTTKGRIYGGYVFLESPTLDSPAFGIRVTVDGALVASVSLILLQYWNFFTSDSGLVNLVNYNMEDGKYALTFNKDITFSEQYLVEAYNGAANNVVVEGKLIYSKIL